MPTIRLLLVTCLVAVLACGDNSAGGPDALGGPQCSDRVDNDGDGMIDFPDDLGCENDRDESEDSTPLPQCSDNRDNDGDGKIDFPDDPGCPVGLADDELDNCPTGNGCPQCADGKDNDGNGTTDFPDDSTGCTSASDTIEFTDDPTACGQGMVIKPLPLPGTDMGTLNGTTSTVSSPCGGGNGLPGIAYIFHLTVPKVMVATTDDPMTVIDTVLDLRSSMCSVGGSELACHDDLVPGSASTANHKSTITKSLQPGTYYLIINGKTSGDVGAYALRVEFLPGEGTSCTTADDCGPGLLCRVPFGQTQMVCAGPVCDDRIDDDSDGKADYPLDPGCASPTDDSETDVCATDPSDPACPQCANGIDDDMDGDIDYPNDVTCRAASTIGEACAQSEPLIVATTPQVMGTTSGAVNDFIPPKGSFNGHACTASSTSTMLTAPDVAIQLDVPAMTSLALRLNPVAYDSAHILLDATCGGTPIECYDSPSGMVLSNLAGGQYFLVVDGWSAGSGTFTLNISGTIVNGESCESALAQSGAITCGPGYDCKGTPGSRTCAPSECNDGMDNNGDGTTDFPADPGCSNASDPVEDTVCPGPSCPACSDGLDNDDDTLIDYPTDTGCKTAAGTNEGCPETDAIEAITMSTTTGTLVGATDDHDPTCVSSNQPDKIFTLDIPTSLQSLIIDTEGSAVDTVLSLMGSSCSGSIACDDDGGVGTGDSLITRGAMSAGSYMIAVDSDSATLDTFVLNVKGTIMPGGSCEGPLFQSGVLVCPPNFGCNGPAGSRTCSAAQCLDGIDNNGDGTSDYPNDPGCDSASDNSETTVCPGAGCPICADSIDNDGDGLIDYPADPRCTAASGNNEGCFDTEAIGSILMPLTTGTLEGATNDHQPACVSSVGTDVIYTLTVPRLESLTIDTEGSVVDTVLSFMGADCSEPALACDDDGGVGTGDSLISRSFVQAGTYTIAIDADSTTNNTFNLNVQGVIAPGESCETPLFTTGVLDCSLGFACDGQPGMRKCVLAQCFDGLDNNGDGTTDFPMDPGCDSFSDATEQGVCPGPACPVCSDGVDNDNDGATDYPLDTSCLSASANNEACTQSEPIGSITQRVTTGTTAGAVNDYTPTCSSSSHNAPDLVYELVVPALDTLTLNVSGFDTAHTLLDSTCGGTPIACSDPAAMTRTNVAAGTYYVVIDGWSSASGPWTLTTTGTIAAGGSCEGMLAQAGALQCSAGSECTGTPGSRTCTPTQCNDTIDNDGDGKTDYPAEPGCTSISDDDEADDCSPTVGPNCPACANTVDDDTDMATDYPSDTGCRSASFFSENFCTIDPDVAGKIESPSTIGTLAGVADNYDQSCQSNTGNDVVYALQLPVPVTTLVIDTIGSVATDTVVSLWNSSCSTSLGCDDDGDPDSARSLLTVSNVPAGDYAIQVDSYSSSNNSGITLNVKGTVAAGAACTHALFTSGVLVCPGATSCTGGICQ